MLNIIKERFIELSLCDQLTVQEQRQLEECRRLLKKHYEEQAWKLGRAMNFLRMAHQTKDWDWVKEIGAGMDQMEGR